MNPKDLLADSAEARRTVEAFVATFQAIRDEVGKFIVGQDEIVENVLIAVIAGGHVLLEGVPGLGKTALVTTLARALDLQFGRVQFTPDLLPADLLGTGVLMEVDGRRVLEFQPGPVFVNILLADEINRATPKTQSALLEVMQEKTVTVARRQHRLDLPFFVLATQNPIEMDGTYSLPEAQLDRFFFKLTVTLPDHGQFAEILRRTCGTTLPDVRPVADGATLLQMGEVVRQVPIDASVQDYLIRLVRATHPGSDDSGEGVRRYVRYGASPRAAQAILTAARARALLQGRYHVARQDVQAVAAPAMRHRVILSFEGEAEGIRTDDLIGDLCRTLE
ncbi:MAG: MoxR family ATPase [Planctomycetes bacterium]|nr:MoxR family ATPase [Planctomycetota bacterium]